MNQLGSNNSRAQREQTLGGNMAHLLSGAWREAAVQSPMSKVQSHVAVDRHWTLDLGLSTGLTESELTEITPLLCRTGAGALAWRQLRDTPLADTPAGRELHQVYRRQRLSALIREREIVAVISLLRAAGIEPVLVKGWSIARRYPDRALRPYGDIDLCVSPAQFAKAKRVVAGFANIEGPFVDLHSGFANIGVDTRRAWMRNLFSVQPPCPLCLCGKCFVHKTHHRDPEQTQTGQRNSADENDWDELYARSQIVSLGAQASCLHASDFDFPVRILCDEDHLRLLCLHLLRSGARRPTWLCDVALLVEQVSSLKSQVSNEPETWDLRPETSDTRDLKPDILFDWSVCLGRNPVHAAWVGVAIGLAHELLGVDISQTPFAGKQLPRWLAPAVLKQWAVGSAEGRERSADYTDYADKTAYQRSTSLFTAYLRNLRTVVVDLCRRWDNPIRSVAAVGGQFNDRSRFRYRVAEMFARLPETPDHLRRLWYVPAAAAAQRS